MQASKRLPRPYPDTFLMDYSKEHLFYEVDMFFEMNRIRSGLSMSKLALIGRPEMINNALLESFVIHFRNIIEFLYEDGRKGKVHASDFCDAGVWKVKRPRYSNTLKEANIRANEEMAHPAINRIAGSPPEKNWDFGGLALEIKTILLLFTELARLTRLHTNVRQAIPIIVGPIPIPTSLSISVVIPPK